MNQRPRFPLQWVVVAVVVLGLFFIFPSAIGFVEMAARELRYLWWLVLLVALAVWLIWASKRRP